MRVAWQVLRGAVEIMSPVYEAPAGGYKIPKKKVIPGIPPCLEKYGDKKTKWTRDKSPKVSTLSGDADSKPVRPERAARGRSMALAKADQKLELQQQEINALEKQVQSLSEQKERSVIKKARQQSLSQLRTRAAHLLHEVKEREAAKRPHGSTEKVLLHSVSALTKDIKSVNSKVDHLASVVQKKNEDDVFGQEVCAAQNLHAQRCVCRRLCARAAPCTRVRCSWSWGMLGWRFLTTVAACEWQ